MTELLHYPTGESPNAHRNFDAQIFGHPDDVLNDRRLSMAEKRALLASWASDANTVPHSPSLRQLPDGPIVQIADILRALRALDAREEVALTRDGFCPWHRSFNRQSKFALGKWLRNRRQGSDDDDDPPPCPAYAAKPPRDNDGGAFAVPEPVAA